MPSTDLADDAAYIWAALKTLQKANRLHKSIPLRASVNEIAGIVQWSIRRVFNAIGRLRDDGREVANHGEGYFIAETREQMESACLLYKKRALTALKRLRVMNATAAKLPSKQPEAQRDFFTEVLDEVRI